ncbi:MAG TPA: hypothetical protein PLZ50_06240, partial [Rubrivivax sp.]|nr:hypothetical protein [Rubrivivax sp.]
MRCARRECHDERCRRSWREVPPAARHLDERAARQAQPAHHRGVVDQRLGADDAQILLGEECLASGSGCRLLITTSGTTVGEFGFPIHFLYGTPFNII